MSESSNKTNKQPEFLKPYGEMDYHPTSEKLVEIICERTRNSNPLFFRVHVAYYYAVLAAMMRTTVRTNDDRGDLPINLYAINLATSGAGKGLATNIMEDQVINQFRRSFQLNTFPVLANRNLPKIANERAIRDQKDPNEVLTRVEKEFDGLGPLLFSFDSATLAAIKQARHKLLMAEAGSINFQMDELGDNLQGNSEAFSAYLELFDVGKIKQKLLKNTGDNARSEEIEGRTPANMMLFGTPSRLFTGDKTEEELNGMLQAGYARRCFFGFSLDHDHVMDISARDLLKQRQNTSSHDFIKKLSNRLAKLADPGNANKILQMSEDVSVLFIEYQLACEGAAHNLPAHEEVRKAEMSHRHFKALKLAGAYAFIDGDAEISMSHAYNAIKLAEDSGSAFDKLLSRDKPYVKLAKYIAAIRRSVTQVDLVEDLPFYKGSLSAKNDMMALAIAYGYQNNILIKKAFIDGIEFLRGETLEETDLNKLIVSHSTDLAKDYKNEYAPFSKLSNLTQCKGLHWVNHHLNDGHRCEENAQLGFNMVVIDVDGGTSLALARELLKDYKALFYTTKRHGVDNKERFRIILPTNFKLLLDTHDFKEFMRNLYEWLPFEVDDQTGQRARKWLSHNGSCYYQDGELLDVLPLIPKTTKNDSRKQLLNDQASMDNLERWVINNIGDGNRNNQLLRYAMILVDAGFGFDSIRQKVMTLNDKLPDKLSEAEVLSTIMITVTKRLSTRP